MPYLASNNVGLLINRALLLNCVSDRYSDLWNNASISVDDGWSKVDHRLRKAGMKGRIHTPQIIDGRSFVAQLKGKQFRFVLQLVQY